MGTVLQGDLPKDNRPDNIIMKLAFKIIDESEVKPTDISVTLDQDGQRVLKSLFKDGNQIQIIDKEKLKK